MTELPICFITGSLQGLSGFTFCLDECPDSQSGGNQCCEFFYQVIITEVSVTLSHFFIIIYY